MRTKFEEEAIFEANAATWREETLKSAYAGILAEDALDYEMGRFQGLQAVKKKKMEEALARDTYNSNLRNAARTHLAWSVYGLFIYGLPQLFAFLTRLLLFRSKELPVVTGYWPVDFLLASPVLLAISLELYYLSRICVKWVWERNPHLVLMWGCGTVILLKFFLS